MQNTLQPATASTSDKGERSRTFQPLNSRDAFAKTLFVIVDAGTAIRNILRTEVFQVLKECKWLRIVIFSPITDEEFRAEFESENVRVEPLPHWNPNLLVKILRSLRKDTWIKQFELARFKEKRTQKGRVLTNLATHLLFRKADEAKIKGVVRRLERWEAACTPRLGGKYFNQYRPDLVFFATMYSKYPCLEIGAKQRGIKTAAFILSWDNPTTKGPFPVRPDWAVLWNNILRDELLTYHGFKEDQLCVAGVPQFDIYTNRERYLSREQFFQKWKLDPAKQLVTYTTGTPGTAPFDDEIIDLLYRKNEGRRFQASVSITRKTASQGHLRPVPAL